MSLNPSIKWIRTHDRFERKLTARLFGFSASSFWLFFPCGPEFDPTLLISKDKNKSDMKIPKTLVLAIRTRGHRKVGVD